MTPRTLDLVTEDLLAAFRALDERTSRPPAPVQGTGSAASGRLTVTLSRAGGLSCQADPGWLSQVDRGTLSAVLDDALVAARAELTAAAGAQNEPDTRLDQLFHEALAILDDPGRLTGYS